MYSFRKIIIISFSLIAISFFIISCASTPQITKVTSLVPLSDVDKKITKNGVTIEVIPINPTILGQYPGLTVITKVIDRSILLPNGYEVEKKFSNVLIGLTFALKVTNNSGHIIKMAGSEVGLTVSGQDIKKLEKEAVKQSWVSYFAKDYPLQRGLPVELDNAINNVNYWDEHLKVLPGKTLESFVTFNVVLKEGIGQSTMSVYDLVTNTDQVGNPTERTNFDFNLAELTTTIQPK
jgi:hypothetical protein